MISELPEITEEEYVTYLTEKTKLAADKCKIVLENISLAQAKQAKDFAKRKSAGVQSYEFEVGFS